MVTEGIVLRHKVSSKSLVADRAKIGYWEVATTHHYQGSKKFFRPRWILDKIHKGPFKNSKTTLQFIWKSGAFNFDEASLGAFCELKEKLISAPIIATPNWSQPFKLICDASDYPIGAILCKWINKVFHTIYYASKALKKS